jgi:hypothetical protein
VLTLDEGLHIKLTLYTFELWLTDELKLAVAAEAPSAYKVTNPLGALSPLDTVT